MAGATPVSSAAAAASASAKAAAAALQDQAKTLNQDFYNYIFILLSSLTVGLIIWRVVTESVKYMRTLACLNNDAQRYFIKPAYNYATFKKHLLYAPILGRRHNREFQLSAAINMGTLPTRFQLFFLAGYLGTNIAFCVVSIDWGQDYVTVAKELRNRSGILAVVNMVPLFIMAARNNPLINWLHLSFDTFNLLHRWFGRIVVLEVLTHAIAWGAEELKTGGWSGIDKELTGTGLVMYGFVALLAGVAITIQASSVVRHAFYETFKYLHLALAALFVITTWYHLKMCGVSELKLLYGVLAIFFAERTVRVVRVVYRNMGRGGTKALVEALPGNACRVTVDLARPWKFTPGQHAYLYMPKISYLSSHPFSVAWSEEAEDEMAERHAMSREDILAIRKTTISFVVRARTGFTNNLFKKAQDAPDGRFYTNCFAEGPYGGMHMMHSYGTVMLFAGGVGITHQVPHVRDLVAGYANGAVATRKIVLVWIIQSPEHLEWIRPWMTSILSMEKRRDVLRIMLFISRPRSTKEIHSPSSTVQMFPGRPNIETLVEMEMENQVGAMGISVCGSGALSDDVRRAVRTRQHRSNIDFIEEAFSW